jgi:hypothetical protein
MGIEADPTPITLCSILEYQAMDRVHKASNAGA